MNKLFAGVEVGSKRPFAEYERVVALRISIGDTIRVYTGSKIREYDCYQSESYLLQITSIYDWAFGSATPPTSLNKYTHHVLSGRTYRTRNRDGHHRAEVL